MKYKLQFNLLIILSILDFFVTKTIVGTNLFLELNPIALSVISTFGYTGLLLLKAIPIVILAYLLYKLNFNSRLTKVLLNGLIVIYSIVVIPGVYLILL